MGQDYSTFKQVFDVVTQPQLFDIPKELARHSNVLQSLYKVLDTTKGGKPITGFETFTG